MARVEISLLVTNISHIILQVKDMNNVKELCKNNIVPANNSCLGETLAIKVFYSILPNNFGKNSQDSKQWIR